MEARSRFVVHHGPQHTSERAIHPCARSFARFVACQVPRVLDEASVGIVACGQSVDAKCSNATGPEGGADVSREQAFDGKKRPQDGQNAIYERGNVRTRHKRARGYEGELCPSPRWRRSIKSGVSRFAAVSARWVSASFGSVIGVWSTSSRP